MRTVYSTNNKSTLVLSYQSTMKGFGSSGSHDMGLFAGTLHFIHLNTTDLIIKKKKKKGPNRDLNPGPRTKKLL